MAKKCSRRQRRAAKAKYLASLVLVAATVAPAGAPAAAAEPIVQDVPAIVQTPTMQEPVDTELIAEPVVEDSAESEVDLPLVESVIDAIPPERLDRDRRLDLAMRRCLDMHLVHLESIMSVMYYVTFGDFLRHACWNIAALDQFRFLQGRTLWFWSSRSGCVATQYGEDVWQLFRYRVRREGAHRRVVTGSILRDRPVRRLLLRPTQQIS
jgi:hypothetical protein